MAFFFTYVSYHKPHNIPTEEREMARGKNHVINNTAVSPNQSESKSLNSPNAHIS